MSDLNAASIYIMETMHAQRERDIVRSRWLCELRKLEREERRQEAHNRAPLHPQRAATQRDQTQV